MSEGEAPSHGQRSDARRNHDLIVTAARAVFAELGVDAPVESIVERAGVGIGTLYRHFASREALVDAIVAERTGEIVEVVERALACSDPARGLLQLIDQMVALQRGDNVVRELLLRYAPSDGLLDEVRTRIEELSEQLVARARTHGVVRDDFTLADLTLVFWSLRPILDATADVAPEAWRRHVGFVLDGLRPQAATRARVRSLTSAELVQAMRALQAKRFQHWHRHRAASS